MQESIVFFITMTISDDIDLYSYSSIATILYYLIGFRQNFYSLFSFKNEQQNDILTRRSDEILFKLTL